MSGCVSAPRIVSVPVLNRYSGRENAHVQTQCRTLLKGHVVFLYATTVAEERRMDCRGETKGADTLLPTYATHVD